MTKTSQNFTMWSGDHKNLTYIVKDTNSASVDLTGGCVVWCLSDTETGASLVRKTSDSASQVTISGCSFTTYLVPADTSGLAGTYWTEGQFRSSASVTGTVATGLARINGDMAS